MRKFLIFILAPALLPFVFPSRILAETPNNIRRDEKIVVARDEVVNDDYFAAGEGVTISGTINGDVFVFGGKTYIDGTVNGDVLAAGGQVTIDGPVSGNVRVAGGDIILSSEIGGNVTVAGGNVLIGDRATINGSLNGAFGNGRILSPIGKSVHITGGQVTLGSEVGKNFKAAAGKLALINGAHIKGDLVYVSDEELDISGGATVDGTLVKKILPEQLQKSQAKKETKNVFMGLAGLGTLIWIGNMFFLGALLLALAPKISSQITQGISKKFWRSLLIGFVAFITIPVVGVVFFMTLVGIPISILVFVAYALILVFGKIGFAYYLGTKIQEMLKITKNRYVGLLLGILAFSLVGIIPVVGWFVEMIGTFAGIGAILVVKKELYTNLRSKKII